MPRHRPRAQILRALRKENRKREAAAYVRHILEDLDDSDRDSDSDSDGSCDDGLQQDLIDMQLKNAEKVISSRRFLFRKSKYRNRLQYFDEIDCVSPDSKRFNDEEFLIHFRMCRSSFHAIVELIKDSKYFKNKLGRKKKASVEYHLLIFLRKMGAEGTEGNSDKIATFMGCGKGSVKTYVKRVRKAILKLKEKVIVWPDEEEKERMKRFIKCKHGFQKCIGIIDGTLVILNDRPHVFGDSYWTRKTCYALNVQVICDHKSRVTYVYGGWPGSIHDNRAWRNSKVFLNASDYFSDGEYLLGDSAYSASKYIVQCFKKIAGQSTLTPKKEFFNTQVGKIRVKSEHCIGLLKNRFPILKRISTTIKGRNSVKRVMDLFECATILHNLLLDYEDDIPDAWMVKLAEGHYWTNDDNGGADLDANGEEDFDRRENVYKAIIEDLY